VRAPCLDLVGIARKAHSMSDVLACDWVPPSLACWTSTPIVIAHIEAGVSVAPVNPYLRGSRLAGVLTEKILVEAGRLERLELNREAARALQHRLSEARL
jgi:hypothetical protein